MDSIMQREEWVDIKGYEGLYQVSNIGRVRSVDRIIEQGSRYGHTINRRLRGRIISATDNGNGYLIVGLKKNQQSKNHYVHRLVAIAFVNNPDMYDVVNHLDYNRSNNRAENLEWTTQEENIRYSAINMCVTRDNRPPASGEKYITKKRDRWRLNIQRKSLRFDRTYPTLAEAIKAREVLIGG